MDENLDEDTKHYEGSNNSFLAWLRDALTLYQLKQKKKKKKKMKLSFSLMSW